MLIRNLVTSLILSEKIKTTDAKGKVLVTVFNKLMTTARQENRLKAIREVNSFVLSELAAKKLIEDIAERNKDRKSGFARRTKLGFRAADGAAVSQVEII